MRKTIIRAGVGAVAIAAGVAGAAVAHPNGYAVSVQGSGAAADTAVYGTTQVLPSGKGVDLAFDNGTAVMVAGCSRMEVEGAVHGGTGKDPQITIEAVSRSGSPEGFDRARMSGCLFPFNTPMTVEFLTDLEFHATGAATSGLEPVAGYLSGPNNGTWQSKWYVTAGGPGSTSCNFTVSGTEIRASFDESAQVLHIDDDDFSGDLIVTSALGTCLGQVPVGSVLNLTTAIKLGKDSALNTPTSVTDLLAINLS